MDLAIKNRTFDTSKCGSQRTKPRPMMSMAALLKALLAVGVDRKLFEFEPPEAEVETEAEVTAEAETEAETPMATIWRARKMEITKAQRELAQ